MNFLSTFERLESAVWEHGTLRSRGDLFRSAAGESERMRAMLYPTLTREQQVTTLFKGVELLGQASVHAVMARPGTVTFGQHERLINSRLAFTAEADNPWKLEPGKHTIIVEQTLGEDDPRRIDATIAYDLWQTQQKERRWDLEKIDLNNRLYGLRSSDDQLEIARLNEQFAASPDNIRIAPRQPRERPTVSIPTMVRLTPSGVNLARNDPRQVTLAHKDIEMAFASAGKPDVSDAMAMIRLEVESTPYDELAAWAAMRQGVEWLLAGQVE